MKADEFYKGSDMTICGDKLTLRKMTYDDTDNIVKWRNNPRVRENFIYRERFTREIHTDWIRKDIDTGKAIQFIICENTDAKPVGSVYFRDIDKEAGSAEYGIFIGEDDAIGKGYGNEAAELAIGYARDVIGLKKVILRVFGYNTAAIKSYMHAGFVKVKDLPMVECSDGCKSDMILMEKML